MNRNVIALLVSAALALPGLAGPITPPPGPVASTHKTLTEVEPRIAINATNTPGDANSLYRIAQPGSYYLTGNLTGVAGKHGIEIGSNNVTIDLNGFTVTGVSGALKGITVDFAYSNLCVRNGSVTNWPGRGIDLRDAWSVFAQRVEDVSVRFSGDLGINVGSDAILTRCMSSNNALEGMIAGYNAVISECAANDNGWIGIVVGDDSVISGSSSHANDGSGFYLGIGSLIEKCVASSNVGHGISANSGAGIRGCVASRNEADGISVLSDSTVEGCTSYRNTGHGISGSTDNAIRDNTCNESGFSTGSGAGIYVSGSDNRIEGNHCNDGDWGVRVVAAGNIIIRNTCSDNSTNWEFVANNVFAPIMNRTAPASGAVAGDAATGSIGTNDANVNITY